MPTTLSQSFGQHGHVSAEMLGALRVDFVLAAVLLGLKDAKAMIVGFVHVFWYLLPHLASLACLIVAIQQVFSDKRALAFAWPEP